jgi:hypothetical protein
LHLVLYLWKHLFLYLQIDAPHLLHHLWQHVFLQLLLKHHWEALGDAFVDVSLLALLVDKLLGHSVELLLEVVELFV